MQIPRLGLSHVAFGAAAGRTLITEAQRERYQTILRTNADKALDIFEKAVRGDCNVDTSYFGKTNYFNESVLRTPQVIAAVHLLNRVAPRL